MPLPLRRIAPAAPADRLDEFERVHGLRLPADYRRFLGTINGGLPGNNTEGVRVFFCLARHPHWSLEHWVERYRSRIPEAMLPFAADGRRNLYCFSHAGPSAGAIFFWDRKRHPFPGELGPIPALPRVADSFTAFVTGLEPFDPDALPEVREENWDAWIGELPPEPARPGQPPPTRVRVKRRPRHWSENLRPPT